MKICPIHSTILFSCKSTRSPYQNSPSLSTRRISYLFSNLQLAYELQQGLQLLVVGDKALLNRARAAFQSHVRAYAARAPDSRAVFQVRSLHLGHVARSFALKDPPTAVKVGKRVVKRAADSNHKTRGGGDGQPHTDTGRGGDSGHGVEEVRVERRRRDGGGGSGGGVRRLGLSKQTERASRAEFL